MTDSESSKFAYPDLIAFTTEILTKAGLPANRAKDVAETLVESDLMGHTTHGLALLPNYVAQLEKDLMTKEGEPATINDSGSAIAWDGQYLPGPWLIRKAIGIALERIDEHPVVTITIQKAHHIGCLAAYPEIATKRGLMILISCSDPHSTQVAPYGSTTPTYSPNPLAAGIPTSKEPIIFDISMSTTAWGVVNKALSQNKKLPHPWLLDSNGSATDDPTAATTTPPATILPLGGLDTGYKGFALGIMVEAMTNALSGHGRKDRPERWGCGAFIQIINPAAFGGQSAFTEETDYFSQLCASAEPIPSSEGTRMPGERAFAMKADGIENGITLHRSIVENLEKCAERHGLIFSKPL